MILTKQEREELKGAIASRTPPRKEVALRALSKALSDLDELERLLGQRMDDIENRLFDLDSQ